MMTCNATRRPCGTCAGVGRVEFAIGLDVCPACMGSRSQAESALGDPVFSHLLLRDRLPDVAAILEVQELERVTDVGRTSKAREHSGPS